jgi:uncharacterized protein DUF222
LSVEPGSIEHMFEPERVAPLIDEIGEAARAESAAIARRLSAVGTLDVLRTFELVERQLWRTDPFEEVAAEISAAQSISRSRAGEQIRVARALRDDLCAVAKVFATGAIDYRLVKIIINRTANVAEHRMEDVDTAIARHCVKWMRLSKPQQRDRVDLWVAKYDPDAVRVPPKVDDDRYVVISETSPGMAGISANIHADAAAVMDAALDELAGTVCANDPRTKQQRRSDACGPLGRREATMACLCGSDDCTAAAERNAFSGIVINVLAEQATLDGSSDQPGYLPGFGILPAESVRELATTGAAVKSVELPDGRCAAGYRPTAVQAAFVRWRDLTCRFPGCDAPAEVCDIDHTKPYPYGPTHPSNNKLYCRTHHLLKTFYAGFGWKEQQFPDGTISWTAPTGHTYSTESRGGSLFPVLARPTGDLGDIVVPDESPHRDVMMPTRRQSRDQDRRARIVTERRKRRELILEQERQRRKWLADNYEPPPF